MKEQLDITYNDYPGLLFLSYDRETAPEGLPFETDRKEKWEYLSKCKGYNEMFAYVAVRNTIQKEDTTTNYLLTDLRFTQVDSNDFFRNQQFRRFFGTYIKAKHGTIMFKNCGQYVYVLLGKKETKELKKRDGRYISVALLRKNFFIGFEEAIITESGLEVMRTGNYEAGMDVGGYLSFVIITLAYADSQSDLPLYESEKIKEKIYLLQ